MDFAQLSEQQRIALASQAAASITGSMMAADKIRLSDNLVNAACTMYLQVLQRMLVELSGTGR